MPFLTTPGGLVRLGLLAGLCLLVTGAGIVSRPVRDDIVMFPVVAIASIVLAGNLAVLLVIRWRDGRCGLRGPREMSHPSRRVWAAERRR